MQRSEKKEHEDTWNWEEPHQRRRTDDQGFFPWERSVVAVGGGRTTGDEPVLINGEGQGIVGGRRGARRVPGAGSPSRDRRRSIRGAARLRLVPP